MGTGGVALDERFSPEVPGSVQIAADQLTPGASRLYKVGGILELDFEFDLFSAAIARELEECVVEFVRETLNECFLRKFSLWMLGSEFSGKRRCTLQNRGQSLEGETCFGQP